MVEDKWAYMVYAGLWMDPLRKELEAFINKANEKVTGNVRVKLYKGNFMIVGRESKNGLYDLNLATYDKGSLFNERASDGFIELWGLQSRMFNKIHGEMMKNQK